MPKEAFGVSYKDLARTGLVPETITEGYHYQRLDFEGAKNLLKTTRRNGEYRERPGVETDETFGQMILYAFHLRADGKFFIYQRGKPENYDEKRLSGQVAVGIGGHMERVDDMSLPMSFKRELGEEVHSVKDGELKGYTTNGVADIRSVRDDFTMKALGILRDGRREVERVHVGVVCRVFPRDPAVNLQVVDDGINLNSKYVSLEEYNQLVKSGKIVPEMWADAVVREEIIPLLNNQ